MLVYYHLNVSFHLNFQKINIKKTEDTSWLNFRLERWNTFLEHVLLSIQILFVS